MIPYNIRHAALNSWDIPLSLTDKWFDNYYLLHWEGIWLADSIKNGVLTHDNIDYCLNWIDLPATCFSAKQNAVSFRRLKGKETGYALVKVYKY